MRKSGKPVVLVANKAEAQRRAGRHAGGLGARPRRADPVSAEHGQGMPDLRDAVIAALGEERAFGEDEDDDDEIAASEVLIGEDIADPDAEDARLRRHQADAHRRRRPAQRRQVDADQRADRRGAAADRPGGRHHPRLHLRRLGMARPPAEAVRHGRHAPQGQGPGKAGKDVGAADGLRAIRFAEVVIIVIDATIPFEKQDLQIADLIVREGRALVIAFNKWDLIEDPQETAGRAAREDRAAAAAGARHPGRAGLGRDRARPRQADGCGASRRTEVWNSRVSTGKLNRWLEGILAHHPPPAVAGRRLKVKYMTQAKTRPPGFVCLVHAARRDAAVLCPLSDQQPARGLRHAGRADPHRAAHLRQPVRRPGEEADLTGRVLVIVRGARGNSCRLPRMTGSP